MYFQCIYLDIVPIVFPMVFPHFSMVFLCFPTCFHGFPLFSHIFHMILPKRHLQDFSSCLSLARPALALLHGEEKTLAEAAAEATASAAGSCWGKAQEAFRTWLGSFEDVY